MSEADSASSTVSSKGFVLTVIVDAHEERDVMTEDISNAFMQASSLTKDENERIHMKITDALVDVSVKMNSNSCESHVVCEKEKKIIGAPTLRDAALVTAIRRLAKVTQQRDIWM